jgi:hypothetical protein
MRIQTILNRVETFKSEVASVVGCPLWNVKSRI